MVINVRCLVIVLLMMIFTGCGMQPQSDNKPNDTYSVVDDYGNGIFLLKGRGGRNYLD